MTTRLRIFLDVDGVLNAVTTSPSTTQWPEWKRVKADGYMIYYAPQVIERIGALAALPGVELRWLTTWEHAANEHLCPLFGWPEAIVMERHDIKSRTMSELLIADSDWWKFDEVKLLHEADPVPFIWIDDDLGDGCPEAIDWLRTLVKGTWLGISPRGDKGITPRLMHEIEDFAHGILGDTPYSV